VSFCVLFVSNKTLRKAQISTNLLLLKLPPKISLPVWKVTSGVDIRGFVIDYSSSTRSICHPLSDLRTSLPPSNRLVFYHVLKVVKMMHFVFFPARCHWIKVKTWQSEALRKFVFPQHLSSIFPGEMCFKCDQIWNIVVTERQRRNFGLPRFLMRLVNAVNVLNLHSPVPVHIFSMDTEDQGPVYCLTTPGYGQKESQILTEAMSCGGMTVINSEGKLVPWNVRQEEGIFVDERQEQWKSVVVPANFVPECLLWRKGAGRRHESSDILRMKRQRPFK